MAHFRIFTGNPEAIPRRYHDALSARVHREHRVNGEGVSTTIYEHWQLEPEAGGHIDFELSYERGRLTRIVGQQPDFPVWAVADTGVLRVYQEDLLLEVTVTGRLTARTIRAVAASTSSTGVASPSS